MSSITVLAIDTTCENADQSFFVPSVALSASSVTRIATVLGYKEFPGFKSSPPKRYRTITWDGFSEQQLWYKGIQIGGARLDFSGADAIDTLGNVTSRHFKIYSVMCDSPNNKSNIVGQTAGPTFPNYSYSAAFNGYFGTNDTYYPNLLGPTELCSSASNPYVSKGNVAQNTPFDYPVLDLWGLWGTAFAGFILSQANVVFSGGNLGVSDENGTTPIGLCPYAPPLTNQINQGLFETGLILEGFSDLQTPQGLVPRPPDWTVPAQIVYENAFSATLSDEFTDAEALANARVVTGNGTTAENTPRTTGFVSQFTTVNYVVSASGLIAGNSYVISVELWDTVSGITTVKQYVFTATQSTYAVNDVVPTPTAQHKITVRNPRIAFAT